MDLDKYTVYRTFKNSDEATIKVRTQKGILSDRIYRGMLRGDLHQKGYTNKDLKVMEQKGWIMEKAVWFDNSRRIVFLWLDQEMRSDVWYKRLVQRLKWWWKDFKKDKLAL